MLILYKKCIIKATKYVISAFDDRKWHSAHLASAEQLKSLGIRFYYRKVHILINNVGCPCIAGFNVIGKEGK